MKEKYKKYLVIECESLRHLNPEETVEDITITIDGYEKDTKEYKRCTFCSESEKEMVGYNHGAWWLLCKDCLEKLERRFELVEEQDEDDKELIEIEGNLLYHLEPEETVKEIIITRDEYEEKREEKRECVFCDRSEKELVGYTYGGGWWLMCRDCLEEIRKRFELAEKEEDGESDGKSLEEWREDYRKYGFRGAEEDEYPVRGEEDG